MGDTRLRIRLTPRGGKNSIDRFEGGVLYARVTAPPVDGSANRAMVELLSDVLSVRKSAIIVVSGEASREKQVEIQDLTGDQLLDRIRRAVPKGDSS